VLPCSIQAIDRLRYRANTADLSYVRSCIGTAMQISPDWALLYCAPQRVRKKRGHSISYAGCRMFSESSGVPCAGVAEDDSGGVSWCKHLLPALEDAVQRNCPRSMRLEEIHGDRWQPTNGRRFLQKLLPSSRFTFSQATGRARHADWPPSSRSNVTKRHVRHPPRRL